MGRLHVRGIEVCLSPPSLHAVAACLGPAAISQPGLTPRLCCPGGTARPDPPLVMASHSLAYLGAPLPYIPQTLPVPRHRCPTGQLSPCPTDCTTCYVILQPNCLTGYQPTGLLPRWSGPPAGHTTPKFNVIWGHFLMNK